MPFLVLLSTIAGAILVPHQPTLCEFADGLKCKERFQVCAQVLSVEQSLRVIKEEPNKVWCLEATCMLELEDGASIVFSRATGQIVSYSSHKKRTVASAVLVEASEEEVRTRFEQMLELLKTEETALKFIRCLYDDSNGIHEWTVLFSIIWSGVECGIAFGKIDSVSRDLTQYHYLWHGLPDDPNPKITKGEAENIASDFAAKELGMKVGTPDRDSVLTMMRPNNQWEVAGAVIKPGQTVPRYSSEDAAPYRLCWKISLTESKRWHHVFFVEAASGKVIAGLFGVPHGDEMEYRQSRHETNPASGAQE